MYLAPVVHRHHHQSES